jgi:threonine dehydrogenase-like Zn-dependent dehydrogenase
MGARTVTDIPARMPALRFDRNVRLEQVDVPRPAAGEALIRIARAGICATDLEITRGYMDFTGTLGHEFLGRIVAFGEPALRAPALKDPSLTNPALGDSASRDGSADSRRNPAGAVPGLDIGTRVVGEINLPCRSCETCRRGDGNHCPTRSVLGILEKDGVFAPYVTLPVENLHPVPEEIDDERAVFAEPLAACLEILEQVPEARNHPVLVIGDGPLGLLTSLLLSTMTEVTLVGRHPRKMALLEPAGVRLVDSEAANSLGRRYPIVVEASGDPSGWDLAVLLARPRGTVILKSTTHHTQPWNPAPLVVDEITVVGSRCGPFPEALRWLREGRVDPRSLLSAEWPLERGVEALEEAGGPSTIKVHLLP